MKSSSLLVAAVAGVAVAKPHIHQHQKRDRVVVYKNVVEQACRLSGAGGTVLRNLAYADCLAGLKNGTYKALGNGQLPLRGASTLITKTIIEEATPTPEPVKEIPPPAVATPKPAVAPPQAQPQAPPSVRVTDLSQGLTTAPEAYPKLHEDFPDGVIPCSRFPVEYAVPVPWQNLGGWASVQAFSHVAANNRLAGLANQVNTNCFSGTYCSYHCPVGMLKAQWPENHQGVNGESVGGLECRNDLLYLTRAHVSRKLCERGAEGGSEGIEAWVQNTLDQVVSVCATNYPGDEAETMWQEIRPGETQRLAIVDGDTYYRSATTNDKTSRQYYLNPKGYTAKEACRWGDGSLPVGNAAPVNIGLGWRSKTDRYGYFSIFNNAPTQKTATLGYNVELTGGTTVCTYDNVHITRTGVAPVPAFGAQNHGCTVGFPPGSKAIFKLY